jgi:hypothetical protein
MTLDVRRTGEAIGAAAAELTRIWRAARLEARPDLFPGTLDAVVEPFIAGVGEALVLGREPEEVWGGLTGVVRADGRAPGGAEDLWLAEWRLLAEVLAAACEALQAPADVPDQVARAVEEARRGTEDLLEGAGPDGVLVVWTLGGFRPRGPPLPAPG